MRKTLYIILLGLLITPGFVLAQQRLGVAPGNIRMPQQKFAQQTNGNVLRVTAAACGLDTVVYPIAKATGLSGLLVNNATSAARVGQYYNAPQAITVHGFRFYGWKTDATGGLTTNAVCQIFNANPADSLPVGAALATVNVVLDTNFGGGDLGVLQKVANFSSPITVTGPYVLVVGNPTANSIGVVVSDYQAGDGQQEWLASADLGGNWTHGYDVTLGPFPFDCDVLLDPLVTYNLAANFSHTPSCVAAAGNVNFVNTSSPVMMDRMYNAAVFLGFGGIGVVWDFGDGNTVRQAVFMDTVHNYAAAGNYIVTLVDTLFGWSGGFCSADTSITLGGPPITQYSAAINGNIVNFTDLTGSVGATYAWDFGDGNTSTLQNPTHTYGALGTFNACLTVTDACGTDQECQTMPIVAVGTIPGIVGSTFTVYPNPNAGLAKVALQLPEAQAVRLSVYNHLGLLVHTADLGEVQSGHYELPLQGLAAGQYLVELRTATTFAVQRMQIVR
jgi:PKD domain/Secretion system C-terminal sorting domain